MKVRDLILLLQQSNLDAEVLIASDCEGNSYHTLDEFGLAVTNNAYNDSDNEISVGINYLTPELKEQGYSNQDIKDNPCIILYPY
jgi:hypothetical protein